MSEHSQIQWTDATWPVVAGCDYASLECINCYAVRDSWRMSHNPNEKVSGVYEGTVKRNGAGKLQWTGFVRVLPQRLDWPLRWQKPRRIFVCNMADLFHEAVPTEFIDDVWAVMLLTPQHTYQVLTKRARRMREYLSNPELYQRVLRAANRLRRERPELGDVPISDPTKFPASHIWGGVSAGAQQFANERIPDLIATPLAVRFVSAEPLLGPVELRPGWIYGGFPAHIGAGGKAYGGTRLLHWVIVGGESGSNARRCDPEWLIELVHQCQQARMSVFVKQLGAVWAREHGADSHGGDMQFWPPELRVREFPA